MPSDGPRRAGKPRGTQSGLPAVTDSNRLSKGFPEIGKIVTRVMPKPARCAILHPISNADGIGTHYMQTQATAQTEAGIRAAAPLVSIGNVAEFDAVREVLHDSEYVQVRMVDKAGHLITYARQIRQRCGIENAWAYAALMAGQVQEVASMVSASALVAWLLDADFYLVK